MIKLHVDLKPEKPEYQRRGHWQKIGRAINRLAELQHAMDQWHAENNYQTYIEEKIQKDGYKTTITKLRIVKQIPIEWSAIIGDTLQNLRAALDHIAFSMVDKKGLSDRQLKKIYFPIRQANNVEIFYEKLLEEDVFSKDIALFLAQLKPFSSGNLRYWHLNELSRLDRHRLLLTTMTGISQAGHDFPSAYDPAGSIWAIWHNYAYNEPIPIEDGMDIMKVTLPARISPDVKMSMTFELFLEEPSIFSKNLVRVMPLLEEFLLVTVNTAKIAESAGHIRYTD